MRQNKLWFMFSGTLAVLAVALILTAGAVAASTYKVLHKFTGKDGSEPYGTLIFDAAGNLYGTTMFGGGSGVGTVFELKPNSDGRWTESVLHSFTGGDGARPFAGLILDGVGNLYGTTEIGGTAEYGGTVFKLTPNSDGRWTESVLHSFTGGDGWEPTANVIFDATGNLYGTTLFGGAFNSGVVFKLTHNLDGSWTDSVLYSFCSVTNCADGSTPLAGLIFDEAGNLYGTTAEGGNHGCQGGLGCGVIFELSPLANGSWTYSVLYSFTGGTRGDAPQAGLIFDAAGSLYGTTTNGGYLNERECSDSGCGLVFKLTPNSDGSWTESVLHAFRSGNSDPIARPVGGLIFDAAGNLYGTTPYSGPAGGGAVFKLAPQSDGSWAYSTLRFFFGKPAENPLGGVVLDKAGSLYGTANACGSGCQGVVFEITP
jgi:uncharacterized repeat protein (TIGR03803 family)